MFTRKNFTPRSLFKFSFMHMTWLTLWSTTVVLLYRYAGIEWFVIPWLPLSVIGTAVAFYIGFKNNSAYDRLWEARKIWGGLINASRYWAASVKNFVGNNEEPPANNSAVQVSIDRLIKRHIAYVYCLRKQLLAPATWEHLSQGALVRRQAELYVSRLGLGLYKDIDSVDFVEKYIEPEEFKRLSAKRNTATHIVEQQSADLAELYDKGLLSDFTRKDLQEVLRTLYDLQGKAERIKNFPLPRQYAGISVVFVGIFIFILPFGVVSQFIALGNWGMWAAIPITALISWVYLVMELVGDYSANPFAGMGNDVPMLSMCRTIEIDLLEMLDEKEIPDKIEPRKDVLM